MLCFSRGAKAAIRTGGGGTAMTRRRAASSRDSSAYRTGSIFSVVGSKTCLITPWIHVLVVAVTPVGLAERGAWSNAWSTLIVDRERHR